MEMSGRHRAPHESIQILRTSVVASKDLKREQPRVYAKTNLKFPRVKPLKRPSNKKVKTTFKAARPKLI